MDEIFNLMGRVVVDGVNEASQDIERLSNEAEDAGEDVKDLGDESSKFGEMAKKAGAIAVKAFAAIATAIGTLTGLSINAYGEYEQLVGGIETLFGTGGQSIEEYAQSVGKSVKEAEAEYKKLEAAQTAAMENAHNAWINQGMSANQYMQTITGFSASLINSLGGDTEKAVEVADMALTDMADNANKMGTDMELIQNAYQGFAKANFDMLDNLNFWGAHRIYKGCCANFL